jgi:hypothetical protein
MYRRASKKQLAYIDRLCAELSVTNPTLYKKFSVDDARRLINRLHKQKLKRDNDDRQTSLL